jgi:hypothetical protein
VKWVDMRLEAGNATLAQKWRRDSSSWQSSLSI